MTKSHLKFFLIPVGGVIIILLIVLIIPLGNKKSIQQATSPTPLTLPSEKTSTRIQIPISSITEAPTSGPSPTLIPLRFTGANLSQDVPTDVKLFSEQKTTLRRLTPLTLSFGTISFDYENDKFIITLKDPKDQSQTAFNTWLKQNYSAIPIDQFSIAN